MLAPLIWGQIADRWVAAEKCISLCAVVAGGMLWWASLVTDAGTFFWLFLVFWLFQMPIMSIGAALTFRHLDHPERQFGPIRVWGTIGWMVASWLLNLWLRLWLRSRASTSPTPSAAVPSRPGFSPCTPSHSPRRRRCPRACIPPITAFGGGAFDVPIRAFQLFRVPAFAVYCVCIFVLYVSWPFNMQMTSLLVKRPAAG